MILYFLEEYSRITSNNFNLNLTNSIFSNENDEERYSDRNSIERYVRTNKTFYLLKNKNLQKRYNNENTINNHHMNTQSKDSNRSNNSIKFKVSNN